MPKPTDEDKEFFQALVPDHPDVEVKPMFGNLGAFVHGNMFMGLFGPDVGVKLDEAERGQLLEEEGSGPFGPSERPMGGYVAIPPAWRRTPSSAQPWIAKSLDHALALPAKVKKPKAAKAAKKSP
jgi:TfoX/Sxy family transcriptional regulator of competence genes